MKKLFYIFAAVLFTAVSCSKEMSVSPYKAKHVEKVTLYASMDQSKTELQSDLSVFWEAGDYILVIGDTLHQFKAVEGGAASVPFTGDFYYHDSLTVDTASDFYAIYPNLYYESHASNVFNVNFPNVQRISADGYDSYAGIALGKLSGDTFTMRQASGLLKFTLSSSDITSIVISNPSNTKFAGTVPVTVDADGALSLGEAQLSSILVIPADTTFFAPGTYYVTVAPATLASGIEFKFTRSSDDAIASKVGANSVTFKRGQVMNFGTIDSDLSWNSFSTKIRMDMMQVDDLGNFVRDTAGNYIYEHHFEYPTSFNSGISMGTFLGQDATLIANETYGSLSYDVHSTTGFAKHKMGLRWGKGTGDYITIPKINGLTLQAVKIWMGGSAGLYQPLGYLSINTDGAPAPGGGMYKAHAYRGDVYVWHLTEPDPNKTYRITCNLDGFEIDNLRWEFIYSGTPAATVVKMTCSTDGLENSNASFIGSFATFQGVEPDSYTCGFEYRQKGADTWSSVEADPDFDFTYDVDCITPGVDYELRSYVEISDGKHYSSIVEFKTPSVVTYTFDFTTSANFLSMGDHPVTATNPNTKTSYDETLINVGGNNNCFKLHYEANGGGFYWNEGLVCYKNKGNSKIGLPVLNGLTLNTILIEFGTVSQSSNKHGIYDAAGNCLSGNKNKGTDTEPYYTDGSDALSMPNNGSRKFVLSKLAEATPYFIQFITKKDVITVKTLTLVYNGVEAPTVQYIKAPVYDSGTLTSQIYFNSVTTDAIITAGFEKETSVAGVYESIATGNCTPLSSGVTTVTASATLKVGDAVRVWVSFDGGATKVSGPVLNVI